MNVLLSTCVPLDMACYSHHTLWSADVFVHSMIANFCKKQHSKFVVICVVPQDGMLSFDAIVELMPAINM